MNKKTLAITALGSACVYIVTTCIAFPIGSFGYVNIGDAIIMMFACIVSPRSAAFIGAIGSMLADVMLAPQYALFTLVIKGIEGYGCAYLNEYTNKNFSFWFGGLAVVLGYALADMILSQQWYMAFPSMGFNSMQSILCIVIAYVGKPLIMRIYKKL